MNADFVSFSLAKKLKEKGYPQRPDNMSCMPYYEYDEVSNYASLCNEIVWYRVDKTRDNIFAAPAIHKVLKWLREEKKIHIEISPQWQYTVYDMRCNPWIGRSDMQNYDDYTKAAFAGIEYVIDNLI